MPRKIKMKRGWKITIIIIVILVVWIRFAPAVFWYLEARGRGEYLIIRYTECEDYKIVFNWSWLSLRFTDIYPSCN